MLVITFGILCVQSIGQPSRDSFAERYVNEEITQVEPFAHIHKVGSDMSYNWISIISGMAGRNVLQFSLEIEAGERGLSEMQHFGKFGKSCVSTYTGNGKIEGASFEILTTIFADSILENIRIAKQVAYIHFPEKGVDCEVRRYEFIDYHGTSERYLLWKELYDTDYFLISTQTNIIGSSTLESAVHDNLNRSIICDMRGRVLFSQSCCISEALHNQAAETLAPGMYLIISACNTGSVTNKLVVTR